MRGPGRDGSERQAATGSADRSRTRRSRSSAPRRRTTRTAARSPLARAGLRSNDQRLMEARRRSISAPQLVTTISCADSSAEVGWASASMRLRYDRGCTPPEFPVALHCGHFASMLAQAPTRGRGRREGGKMTVTKVHSTPTPAELQRPRDEELDLFGLTHQGLVRPDNQDHFLICTVHPQVVVHSTNLPDVEQLPLRGTRLATVMLVADGVGGGAAGAEASRLAAEAVTRYVSNTLRSYHAAGKASDEELLNALKEAAFQAHDTVRAESATRSAPKPMATTLTLALAIWPWFYVLQIGDSRCYYWNGSELQQVTRDQTIAQQLVDQGALSPDRVDRS